MINSIVLNQLANGWGYGPVDVSAADRDTAVAQAQTDAAAEFSFKGYATTADQWTLAAAPVIVGYVMQWIYSQNRN